MQFTTSTLAAILAFTSSATASPLQTRQESLQDWQVTGLGIGTPSGRPLSYPWATINGTVTDPNEIVLGTADDGTEIKAPGGSKGINCVAKYFTKGENPLGRTWPCDPVGNGYWTMEILVGTTGAYTPSNLNVKFTHFAEETYRGQRFAVEFEAEGNFAVGDELGGSCGGSGVCGWGLKNGPVSLTPKKV